MYIYRVFKNKKELLIREYIEKQKTIAYIAKKYNCAPSTVHRWLLKFGIPRRVGGIKKGVRLPLEWRKNISLGNTGRKFSATARENLRLSHLGKIHSGSFKKGHKLCLGRVVSTETREKISMGRKKAWERKRGANYVSHRKLYDKFTSLRDSWRYRAWSKEILKRFNYTCQKCLERGGNLVAHHIIPIIISIEEIFNLNNGACLCKSCHRTIHINEY